MADDLAAAWGEEGAMEGEVSFGAGVLPSERAAAFTLLELTVHAWDLAKATGQTHVRDPGTEQLAAGITAQAAGPNGREGGFFGPEVPVSEEASAWHRALGQAGRGPDWTP